MKLIDANVVIYSRGVEHEYREPSRHVMRLAVSRGLEATIDVECIQEVVHYYHKQKLMEAALSVFDELVVSLPPPYPIDLDIALLSRDILSSNPFLQVRDAVHTAVVFRHNLEGIISADRAFDRIEGLKRFDPKELTV